jgi:hypothetical protein
LLDDRRNRRVGPDRSGDLAVRDLVEGVLEPPDVPIGLEGE